MTGQPILFVAGLGRCGTTLMMTMLDAGGFPVSGPRPSYEIPNRWRAGRPDITWLNLQGGKAVKWIDPTRNSSLLSKLNIPSVVLLLERDAREQARSQIKLISEEVKIYGRRAEKAMERSIRHDSPIVRARLRTRAIVYPMRFEDILKHPKRTADLLQRLIDVQFGQPFDAERAAAVVISRHPSCAPDLSMERLILPMIAADLEVAQ